MKDSHNLGFYIVPSNALRSAEAKMQTENPKAKTEIEQRARADVDNWLNQLVESGLSPEAMELYMLDFVRRVERVSGHWASSESKAWNIPFNANRGALASAELLAMSRTETQSLLSAVLQDASGEKVNLQ